VTLLEGGCRVVRLRDRAPARFGTARVRPLVGRATGTVDISLRLLEFETGTSPKIHTGAWDDVWYVLEGEATLRIDGRDVEVAPGTGIYLGPGTIAVVNVVTSQPLVVASACCPEPVGESTSGFGTGSEAHGVAPESAGRLPVVRLDDRREQASGDRWYRVLVNEDIGSRRVTQFVGSIPPGRAPDHFHHYEEVIVILAGEGRQWAGVSCTPIAPGSCIYLPKGQVHCVENTGSGALVLLGIFYPAGSPAVAYETGPTTADDTGD